MIVSAFCGCSTSQVLLAHRVDLVRAHQTVGEEELLDVGILVFDPGVPEGEIDKDVLEELLEEGVFVHIRRAESVQMAVQLRDTMRRSGHWGSLWVTPKESMAADVNVTARILGSDGYVARVDVRAIDAVGRVWIDKQYELETSAGAYDVERYGNLDPYQDLFNSIANDIAAARATLPPADVHEIKTVAALRYAGELSPPAFGHYVAEAGRGTYEPVRLPAADDPLFERAQRVRQRERLFLETLGQHYEKFAFEAEPSYDAWREHAREESLAIREATRSARWQAALGAAAMIASIASANADLGSFADRFVRDGMFLVGAELLNMRTEGLRGREMHSAVLEELSNSFDDEVAPMVVEIAGVEHRLTGTAEAQYAEWRNLFRSMFIRERGFPQEISDQRADGGECPCYVQSPIGSKKRER